MLKSKPMNLPSVFFYLKHDAKLHRRSCLLYKVIRILNSFWLLHVMVMDIFFRFGWASWIFHINLCVSWDSDLIFDHFKIKIDNDIQNNSKISYSVAKMFSTFLMGSNFISMKKTTTEKINAKVRFIFKIKKPLNLFHHNYWHE